MAQNIYDDPKFLAGYSEFPRSRDGLEATSEWPALRALLPEIAGKRVVDLGCGFGQLSRWLGAEGARSVLGIDLSEKMLARAVAETSNPAVTYARGNLDELVLARGSADLIVSSMALHYVEDFDRISGTLYGALAPGGQLVFSVEHPIYAARAEPEWVAAADGRQAFAIADYLVEGRRVTNWIVDGIVKFHRTIGTMLNILTGAGFEYRAVNEWKPSDAQFAAHPEWRATELTRPMFLLMSLTKPAQREH
ncbi:SAM-dependent methyltransferase [Devosia sp. Root413D1]|uniref:class I SAM-dependent methyltransferase n=1 Tax=unclassified Devosia TaxID=196773 RepID=UPI0006F891EE|nr:MULTISPECIES: class I SAM-dependent methyltransferase [unclassified Devosia]KQU93560.1 SAM-dependent methyltransferase [Devosia sp. Root105]KQW75107.1 SAM-dependent methyltransferase [Devosia sp. Root413D1]